MSYIYVRSWTENFIPVPRRTHGTRIHYNSTFQTQNARDLDDTKNYCLARRLIQNSRNILQNISHTKWEINLKILVLFDGFRILWFYEKFVGWCCLSLTVGWCCLSLTPLEMKAYSQKCLRLLNVYRDCLSEIKKLTAVRFYSFQSELKALKAINTWPKVRQYMITHLYQVAYSQL